MGHLLPHAFTGNLAATEEKSFTGYLLLYAFAAQGSLLSALEFAVSQLLRLLYQDIPRPQKPKSGKTPRKNSRNDEIKLKYAEGTSVPDLAKEFGISVNRVYQILSGKRK